MMAGMSMMASCSPEVEEAEEEEAAVCCCSAWAIEAARDWAVSWGGGARRSTH